ncbi:hypothetical protein DET54_11547 [Paenibacillus pabuli]|uniref:Uncharacterized protein n=1 Tax=Paenibacillus pabuli TaxID=1472 RepID=A0A855Y076_9BACL|nr:hypothetical protein DET56_11447 [Paenibacillus pabuli]PXW01558.1 hypothetical protein DEU73_11346 [Paenibacillus taichungensis]RAI88562.1 hypothetical protein DET54_11547 [Paenibacillus pabuli]
MHSLPTCQKKFGHEGIGAKINTRRNNRPSVRFSFTLAPLSKNGHEDALTHQLVEYLFPAAAVPILHE